MRRENVKEGTSKRGLTGPYSQPRGAAHAHASCSISSDSFALGGMTTLMSRFGRAVVDARMRNAIQTSVQHPSLAGLVLGHRHHFLAHPLPLC
jgi:hypothetical protein